MHEEHGFTPFELVFGRSARGLMKILKELWTGESVQTETRDEYNYMLDLEETISETCKIARQDLQKSQVIQ